jgi:Neuraminidase (sialidase)
MSLTSCYSCKRQDRHSGIFWHCNTENALFKAGRKKEYWYPRLLRLKSGELFCVFDAKIENQDNKVMITKRIKGKQKWQKPTIVSFGKGQAANGHMIELENGNLLLAYRLVNNNKKTIKLSLSQDKGKTWQHISTVTSNNEGLWEPFLLNNRNNEIMIFYANEKYRNDETPYPQVIEMRRSFDNGVNWTKPEIVSKFKNSREGMPAVAKLDDKTIMTVFEANYPPHPLVIMYVISKDNGKTWGSRKLLYKPEKPGKRAAAPFIIKTKNSNLFVSFQTDEDKYATGELFCEMKVLESSDSGETWANETKPFCVKKGFALWNSLLELPGNRIMAASSVNVNYKGSEIRLIKGTIKPVIKNKQAIKR